MAKVSRKASGLNIAIDLSSAARGIGAGVALTEAVKDEAYTGEIIKAAHGLTEVEFNTEAAAFAAAGGPIKHMFEWGTAGINRGRTNMRPSPTSVNSRLWETILTGRGMNQTLNYVFKPSLALVPLPTARDTGMDQETISMLRRHVFQWKARVMETGEMVHIVPVEAKYLLIPLYPGMGGKPSEVERGYILTKGPINAVPGRSVRGNFTAYWTQFWEGRGASMMNNLVEKQLESDFLPSMKVNSRSTPIPPLPGSFQAAVKKEAKKTRAKANQRARTRGRTT